MAKDPLETQTRWAFVVKLLVVAAFAIPGILAAIAAVSERSVLFGFIAAVFLSAAWTASGERIVD